MSWQAEKDRLENKDFFKHSVLRSLIHKKKISYTDFAKLLGVNKSTVTHWLNGSKCPNLEHFYKMCKILEVDPSVLLNF
jgi:transcriptional regulator with XRE-family HTH domain